MSIIIYYQVIIKTKYNSLEVNKHTRNITKKVID